jgi:hypothetical protein
MVVRWKAIVQKRRQDGGKIIANSGRGDRMLYKLVDNRQEKRKDSKMVGNSVEEET